MSINVAVVGATGLVGQELLRIVEAEGAPLTKLGLFASQASAGMRQRWLGEDHQVVALDAADFSAYHAVFFCVGDELSARHVPSALAAGCSVIDKSNAFRLAPDVPLLVVGVNDEAVTPSSRLVANPNCTTIILVHALWPLQRRFGLKRVWVATYQSASGAGAPGVRKLSADLESAGPPDAMLGHAPGDAASFAYNVVPAIGSLDSAGRCGEEAKLIAESRKILDEPGLPMAAHTVRVPVVVGHSMAVSVELGQHATATDTAAALASSPDVQFIEHGCPTPVTASSHDRVEVGRLRSEDGIENGWSFFVSGDNLRIGAALNGWRIFKLMLAAGAVSASARSTSVGRQ
jgi:aspartate-semialdehyde dehydrogenase